MCEGRYPGEGAERQAATGVFRSAMIGGMPVDARQRIPTAFPGAEDRVRRMGETVWRGRGWTPVFVMRFSTKVLSRALVGSLLFGAITGVTAGELDEVLGGISPDVKKWASVAVVTGETESPRFEWHHYRDSEEAVGFWPASTIKIYAVVAALEYLNELGMPLDCALTFERKTGGEWKMDCARSMREMISEVFRRSSNEDYTLLLRFVGVDRINARFLTPARGFPHSALMRGYVGGRPYGYIREEPQRITIHGTDGRSKTVEHTWSGRSYSKKRGATIISATTGNCTSTKELAECLRRILFHESLPAGERYHLTDEQARFIREGGAGLTGLRNKSAGAFAWTDSAESVFPNAKFYHKGGRISTHTLDVAYIDDVKSGKRFIVCVAANSGKTVTVKAMAKAVAEWAKAKE